MENGSYISIDLDTKMLKRYYSTKSPHGAYAVIKRYLTGNGYEHLKDTNYRSRNKTEDEAAKIIYDFVDMEKWFAPCVNKVNITPLNEQWDLTTDIMTDYLDEEWLKKKDKAAQEAAHI